MVSTADPIRLLERIRSDWATPPRLLPELTAYLDQGDEDILSILNGADIHAIHPIEVRAASAIFSLCPPELIAKLLGMFMTANVKDSLEADVCVERVASFIFTRDNDWIMQIFSHDQLEDLRHYFRYRADQTDSCELERACLDKILGVL